MAVTNLDQTTNFMQQINVADMFTSMALSIAQAQQKLDENSIASLEKLIDTKIGDKSLLELGFHPAFYQFKYADLSASININFKLSEYQSVGGELSFEYDRFKDFEKEKLKEIEKKQEKSKRKEFKSSKDVIINIERDREIEINKQKVNIKDKEKSISKIRNLEADIRAQADIARVESEVINSDGVVEESSANGIVIENSNGFVTIYSTEVGKEGILEIVSFDNIDVNISGANKFKVEVKLEETITNATSALGGNSKIIGIEKGNFTSNGIDYAPMELHFPFDEKYVDFDYTEGTVDNATPNDELIFRILAHILSSDDTDVKLRITGYTDAVGKSSYNTDLGIARAEFARGVLISMGANPDRIDTATRGELEVPDPDKDETDTGNNAIYRKVNLEILSESSFLFLKGDNFDSSATSTASLTNKFVWLNKIATSTSRIEFKYKETSYFLDTSAKKIYTTATGSTEVSDFQMEVFGNIHYLLHKEKNVHVTAYSNTLTDIDIQDNYSKDKDTLKTKDKILISDSINSKSLLKRATAKKDGTEYISVNGSIDYRQTKQFDLSVQGNASIEARLEAVPSPDAFKVFLENTISEDAS